MVSRERAVPLAVAVCAALVPLSLAACGASEADKTPTQILQDASAAIKAVTGYHVSGAGQSGGTTSTFDLHIGAPGALSGTLSASGASFNLIVVNGTAYIKGQQFLQQVAGSQAAQLFDDNWVKAPQSSTTDITQGVAALTDTKKLGGCLVTGFSGASLTKSTATINGQSVVAVQTPGITMYFASSGTPYLVQVKTTNGSTSAFDTCMNGALSGSSGSTGSSSAGTLNFDSWGTAVTITPPPHPIDLSGLSGG